MVFYMSWAAARPQLLYGTSSSTRDKTLNMWLRVSLGWVLCSALCRGTLACRGHARTVGLTPGRPGVPRAFSPHLGPRVQGSRPAWCRLVSRRSPTRPRSRSAPRAPSGSCPASRFESLLGHQLCPWKSLPFSDPQLPRRQVASTGRLSWVSPVLRGSTTAAVRPAGPSRCLPNTRGPRPRAGLGGPAASWTWASPL